MLALMLLSNKHIRLLGVLLKGGGGVGNHFSLTSCVSPEKKGHGLTGKIVGYFCCKFKELKLPRARNSRNVANKKCVIDDALNLTIISQ